MIGGGLIVAYDLIHFLHTCNLAEIVVVCPANKKFAQLPKSLKRILTPSWYLKPYMRWKLDFIWLPKTIRDFNPDLLITLSNLPARVSCPQLMVNDNAFINQQKIKSLGLPLSSTIRHYIRKKLFWNRINFISFLLVQTEHEKERFKQFKRKLPPIEALPQLLPSHLDYQPVKHIKLPEKPVDTIRLACIAYDWPHKNLKILSELLQHVHKSDNAIELILTVNEKKSLQSGVLKLLESKNLQNHYINVGNVAANKVVSLIRQCDGVILPSKLESLSLNYLEAWFCEKPLFVSDRPFSRLTCQDAATYFDPESAADIFKTIINSFNDQNKLQSMVAEGNKKLEKWDYSNAYEQLIIKCLES